VPTSTSDPVPGLAAIAATLRAAGCVFAEEEALLLAESARTPRELRAMTAQRAAGLPLEHVVGWAGFCELRIAVGPGVFVPRRRSELLARQTAALTPPGSIVVDLACGSGALGLAIAALVPDTDLHACDIDPVAVACARRNVEPAGGHVYAGDLYEPLPAALRGRVTAIAANLPYVPTGQLALMPAEARDHEPVVALDGGPDGLDVLRRAAAGAGDWLRPGGHLLIETSLAQAAAATAVFAAAGLAPASTSDQDLGATIVIGRR
jgi:release factor glutamine methyltransferase